MTEQMQIKAAFIVAMRREVKPLLERCERLAVDFQGVQEPANTLRHPQSVYRWESGIVVCSGPGYKNAASAARQAIDSFSPEILVSIGFAGALAPGMKVGDIFVPRHIVSERTGSAFTSPRGKGSLVTADTVVGADRKRVLFKRFQAQAVDMEAAAVAAVAASRDCEFLALKVISDELDTRIDFVEPFIRPEGFRLGAFVAHLLIRPWLWPRVFCLWRDSCRAAENLSRAVRVFVMQGTSVLEDLYANGRLLEAELKGS
jgi:adenosylhomocysteine nucleosidase